MHEMQIFYTDGEQEHRLSLERLVCELPDGRRLALFADDEGQGQWRLLLATVPEGQAAQCLGVFPLAANMLAVRPLAVPAGGLEGGLEGGSEGAAT
ncbi:MAG: hypothetical protein ACOYB1_11140 [Limnohabitans sp.]